MRVIRPRLFLAATVSTLLAACADPTADAAPAVVHQPPAELTAASTYSVKDISSGPNEDSYAWGINDNNVVAGWSNRSNGTHGWVRTTPTQLTWLREPAGTIGSEAWAIANNGSIAGTLIYPGGTSRPAFWRSRTAGLRVIPLPSGALHGDGLGVNNLRQVAGTYFDAGNLRQAFVWSAATNVTTTLGTLGGLTAQANDINDLGQVTGCADGVNGQLRAFRWTSTTGLVQLDGFYPASCAYGINGLGDASGWISTGFADSAAVFLAAGTSRRFLGPGASAPNLQDLNDAQTAVGFWTVGGTTFAIAADAFTVTTTLPMLPGATSAHATAINTCGRIVGYVTTTRVQSVWWRPPGC